MASLSRRLSSVLLAAAMVGALVEPSVAQVSPGAPTVGPAGGTPSTTAPSNQDGTPAGGTGVVGQTRVGPGYGNDGRITLNPQQEATERAPAARRHTARHERRAARRQARRSNGVQNTGTGAASSSGLNGSNAPSSK